MINIIYGSTKKPISSKRLSDFFSNHNGFDGSLFIGYPIIGTPDGPFPIDALWVSRQKGLIIFNLIEGRDLGNYKEEQDDSANKLEAKLRNHKTLMKGRDLLVPIHITTFAPIYRDPHQASNSDYMVCDEQNLEKWLNSHSWDDPHVYEHLVSIIQSISTIRKGRKRRILYQANSRGAILKNLEDSIANLDNLQGRAVIETVDGVQRIRGLAGSGKTIILALKAAYLHAQHPDWKIAVTFNTRSLKGQFKQLINTFVIEQTSEEPDWENLHITHAWGAPGGGERSGIYYRFCQKHSLEYFDYRSAKSLFGTGNEFEGACSKALSDIKEIIPEYNAILIDEAQDFPPIFLRLCYEFVDSPKRLVYAYDELQNLSTKSLPSPEEIFGTDPDGTPRVHFEFSQQGEPQQDIVLKKCYRNSRPILTTAHALGFGIYRTNDRRTGTGLVQIFEQNQLWLDVGYTVENGELKDGHEVTLTRTEESSPKFLESHSPVDDIIQFHRFSSKEEQDTWVVDAIEENINNDELRYDDIVVINPNPLTTTKEVGAIRKMLYVKKINSHLAGVDTSPDIFFESEEDSITFTGIYRAKGNEAGMVYIINADDCCKQGNLSTLRNRLFTAITRSKAWVRVLGVGSGMEDIISEFNQVKKNNFKLTFHYPTKEERTHINIIHRDMTIEERKQVQKKKGDLSSLLDDIESGRVYIEDFDSDQIERLRVLLERK